MSIEIFQSQKNEKYYFRLLSPSDAIEMVSTDAYADELAARTTAAEIIVLAKTEDSFLLKTAKNGKRFYVIKRPDGDLLAKSELFDNEVAMADSLAIVKTMLANDPDIVLEEKTVLPFPTSGYPAPSGRGGYGYYQEDFVVGQSQVSIAVQKGMQGVNVKVQRNGNTLYDSLEP